HDRAVRRLLEMNHRGLDPAINHSHRDASYYSGLFGGDHDRVAGSAFAAQRRQRTTGPDDIEFVDLDRLFRFARFRHLFSLIFPSWMIRLVSFPAHSIVGETLEIGS